MWMANVISYDFLFVSSHLRPVSVILLCLLTTSKQFKCRIWWLFRKTPLQNSIEQQWRANELRITIDAVCCMFWQCFKCVTVISLVVELNLDYPQITMYVDDMTMFNSSNTFSVSISWDSLRFSMWVWYNLSQKWTTNAIFFYHGRWPDVSLISFLI